MLQENNKNVEEIELSEFLFAAVKQWRRIIVIALALALLMGIYKSLNPGSAMSDEKKQNIVSQKNEIDDLKSHINEKSEHLDKSIYYNLNPFNYYQGKLLFYVTSKSLSSTSLIGSYSVLIEKSVLYEEINKKLGSEYDIRYLKEIIDYKYSIYEGNFSVSISFADSKSVEIIMDIIKNEFYSQNQKLNNDFQNCSINLLEESISNDVDSSLGQTINNEREALAGMRISLNEKETAYNESEKTYDLTFKSIVIASVKYAVLGFIIGSMFSFVYYSLSKLLSIRIKSSKQLERVYNAKILSEFSDDSFKNKRIKKIDLVIAKYSDNIINLPQEDAYKILISNIDAFAVKNSKILLTGTIQNEYVKNIYNELLNSELKDIYKFKACDSLLSSGEALIELSESDSVVLIEKRNLTLIRDFEKQIKIINDYDKPIIGITLL